MFSVIQVIYNILVNQSCMLLVKFGSVARFLKSEVTLYIVWV